MTTAVETPEIRDLGAILIDGDRAELVVALNDPEFQILTAKKLGRKSVVVAIGNKLSEDDEGYSDQLGREWTGQSLCRGLGESYIFVPEVSVESDDNEDIKGLKDVRTRLGKAICSQCPVRIDCIDYALSNSNDAGIWGGLESQGLKAEARKRAASRRRYGQFPQSA